VFLGVFWRVVHFCIMEWSQVIEEVRSVGAYPQEEGAEWNPLLHLDSADYSDYLLKWGRNCIISAVFVDHVFPAIAGIYDFSHLPENHCVWILEAEGPNVLIGGDFMPTPKRIWSKFVIIGDQWMRPRNNVFIHENEPQFEEVPNPRQEEE